MSKQTQALSRAVERTVRTFAKHSPAILTGIGIAGMVAAAVSAVRETPKALKKIDEREWQEGRPLTKKEVVQTTWKCYIPAVVTGTLSAACLIGANSVNAKRNAALATAYTLSEAALKDYKDKTVEIVGEKKEQEIREAVAEEQLKRAKVEDREPIITGHGTTRCYDPLTDRYFESDIEFIRKAENNINRQMRDDIRVSLNEFYDEIGLDDCDLGDRMGWDIDKGYIDLYFTARLDKKGRPCLVVGHNNPPQYMRC